MEKLFLVKRDTDKYEVEVRKDSEVGGGYVLDCKLSFKNCQEVERGYDLDKLSHEEYLLHENNEELYGHSTELKLAYKAGVWDGLKRTVEILGDKKFSEEDMRKGFEAGYETLASDKTYNEHYDKLIQSLQQTEWEVEIVTEESEQTGENVWTKPKFDENGCVILKRK